MKLLAFLRVATLLLLAWSTVTRANTVTEWGQVSSSLGSEVSFSFARYDIRDNFLDVYNFSLEGSSGATYTVTFAFDPCRNGCGSPDLSYGIYDRNGNLYDSTNGAVTLSAGNYAFQVKGNGMGSGNSVDYWGSVTFATAAPTSRTTVSMVSPAPEPSTFVMLLAGLAGIALMAVRRRDLPNLGVPA